MGNEKFAFEENLCSNFEIGEIFDKNCFIGEIVFDKKHFSHLQNNLIIFFCILVYFQITIEFFLMN